MVDTDLIVAVATPVGRGGVGIVRLSGRSLAPVISQLLEEAPPPRRATLSRFYGDQGEAIDRGIAIYFPGPNSYTGEDVLELHGHGNPVVMRMLVHRCMALGARLAEPGEFTKRAFLNDKLDLAQAEAVADLVDASTERAARAAVQSLEGRFSKQIEDLARELTDLRVRIEASLDFPEDDPRSCVDVDLDLATRRLSGRIVEIVGDSRRGVLLRDGIRVVLGGPPNAGKSSLLNRLAGEDLAIVTPIPGTTRDLVRATVDMDGVPVHFVDTAGLRASPDPIEQMGVSRAEAALGGADVVLLIEDGSASAAFPSADLDRFVPPGTPRIRVVNKVDLTGEVAGLAESGRGPSVVKVSALTGAGMASLSEAIFQAVGWTRVGQEGLMMARTRHVHALEAADRFFRAATAEGRAVELVAENLRLAQEALGSIAGRFTSEDLLGEIFGRFCIGK